MRVSIRSEQAPQLPADHVDRPVDEPTNPRLSVSGWARWAWRQLTSMRTALVLLLLLAVAAIPGSLVPQQGVSTVTLWGGLGGLALTGAIARQRRTPAVA